MQTLHTNTPIQRTGISAMVKSGFGGICTVYLTSFGLFLSFGSIGLFVTGSFADESGLTIAGIVMVVLGLICIAISIGLCVYVSKQMRATQDTLVGQPIGSGMTHVVMGMSPPQVTYPQAGYPQIGYPQAGDPQTGYPQAGNPQTGYRSIGAAPAVYPQGTNPPPQQAYYPSQQEQPGYTTQTPTTSPPQQLFMTDPQSGYQSMEKPNDVSLSAPPPNYNEVSSMEF